MAPEISERIARDPRFLKLQKARMSYAVTLTILMLVIYYGFILVIAFAPGLLAIKIASTMTLGIPVGIAVILAAIALTGLYVRRANTEFDPATRQILEGA